MMNERIEELAQGCFEYFEGTLDGDIVEFNYKKFAELIVKECASLFDGTKEMKTVGMLTHNQVIEQIKQHFGVER